MNYELEIMVSVVVPVYNTAKYLEKCLTSLVRQTLDDFEIIIVNDGSTDNSQTIIDDFAGRYHDKIISIKQENKGLGPARNTGVAHAKGEYIGFVDSDDYVEPDMFKSMYEIAVKDGSDVVTCDFVCFYDDGTPDFPASGWPGNKEAPETVSDFVLYSTNPSYSWNRLYRRELLIDTPFPPGYYEDIATTPVILSKCKKISYMKKPLYRYLRRQGAISTQKYNPKNLDLIPAWKRCFDECSPDYIKEIEYAVYFSVSKFIEYKRDCYPAYMEFFKENEKRFKDNQYIREAILNNEVDNLFYYKVIPKIIHYHISADEPGKEVLLHNINTWRELMPDYEFICHREDNRLDILYEHGGIFIDAAIMLYRSLNEFLRFDAFFSMRSPNDSNSMIIGCLPKNEAIRRMSAYQAELCTGDTDIKPGINDDATDIKSIITHVLSSDYGLKQNIQTQILKGNIAVMFTDTPAMRSDTATDKPQQEEDIQQPDMTAKQSQQPDIKNEYAKSVIDFLTETSILIEQINTLPKETLAELSDMYEITSRVAAENSEFIDGNTLSDLKSRQKIIRKMMV